MQLPPIGSGPIGNVQGAVPQKSPKELANDIIELTQKIDQAIEKNPRDIAQINEILKEIKKDIEILKTANLPPEAVHFVDMLSNTFDQLPPPDTIRKLDSDDLAGVCVRMLKEL